MLKHTSCDTPCSSCTLKNRTKYPVVFHHEPRPENGAYRKISVFVVLNDPLHTFRQLALLTWPPSLKSVVDGCMSDWEGFEGGPRGKQSIVLDDTNQRARIEGWNISHTAV